MLLIDGDVLVYTSSFVCEKTWYELDFEETGEVLTFKTKTDLKAFNKDISPDLLRKMHFHLDESILYSVIDTSIKGWLQLLNRTDYKIYLTDISIDNNFRYKLDNTYKQNRKDLVKPFHYMSARDYLVTGWGADVVVGMEADDAIGIELCQVPKNNRKVTVSIDKDLLQLPGKHYLAHHKKKVVATKEGSLELYKDKAGKKILTGTGFKWFAAQMILGDQADNIVGIKGDGPVAAYDLLKDMSDIPSMWGAVKKRYEDKGQSERLLLNAQLLWILRETDGYFDETRITV